MRKSALEQQLKIEQQVHNLNWLGKLCYSAGLLSIEYDPETSLFILRTFSHVWGQYQG